eukprot:7275870-Alexandrium_andersonii.AAC.1
MRRPKLELRGPWNDLAIVPVRSAALFSAQTSNPSKIRAGGRDGGASRGGPGEGRSPPGRLMKFHEHYLAKMLRPLFYTT